MSTTDETMTTMKRWKMSEVVGSRVIIAEAEAAEQGRMLQEVTSGKKAKNQGRVAPMVPERR
jgi:hypothetical protein